MSLPNINSAISLVAYAKVSAATPPVVTDAVGITGVVRNGAGDWTVTLADEIDNTQRSVTLTTNQAAAAHVQKNSAVQTDATIGVLGFDLAVPGAVDCAWEIKVERVSNP